MRALRFSGDKKNIFKMELFENDIPIILWFPWVWSWWLFRLSPGKCVLGLKDASLRLALDDLSPATL